MFVMLSLQENGAAFEAGGLEVGQLILEVDGQKVEGTDSSKNECYRTERNENRVKQIHPLQGLTIRFKCSDAYI
jgi:C-terminal processing protease CtpA/Prc